MSVAPYAARRERAFAQLGDGSALVLAASPELHVGRDTELRYASDADVYYLSGYTEPEAVLVLCPSCDDGAFTMFVRAPDPERELWTGPRGGVEEARERYAADAAYPIAELHERLPKMLRGVDVLYARIASGSASLDALLPRILEDVRRRRPRRGTGVTTLVEPGVLLDEMRLHKDAHELALLHDAARITVAAFEEARTLIRAGAGAWEIEAALEGGFRKRGAQGPAFPSIVAAGTHATTLHYIANDARIEDGQLVLLDAGARHAMYCADISRTYAAGDVHADVRALHQLVLHAHDAAIDAARPGATIAAVHDAAASVLLRGLRELGLAATDPDEKAEAEALRRYYPHQTSHWLGLEVHDVGDYVAGGSSRALEAGMVLTVEPGLYIAASDEAAPPALRGVGVRIEDDLVVLDSGVEVITAGLGLSLEL